MSASEEWRKHWPTVLAGMVGMSFYAMFTYSFGAFIEPISHEFGWSRAEMSLGYTIYAVSPVLLGPFVGALIDKVGARPVGIWGVILSALGFADFSLNDGTMALWFELWGFLSLAAVLVKSTVWGAAIISLFNHSRGLALAVMLSGSALAQSLGPLIANSLIADHGWRFAYQAIALGWGGLSLVLVVLCFFDRLVTAAATKASNSALNGLTVQQAFRSKPLWRIGLANLIMALVGSGITVHLFEVLISTGLSRSIVATILILQGVAGLFGKLVTGWLFDRIEGSWLPFMCYALQGVADACLLFAHNSLPLAAVGVLLLGWSAGAGLQATTYLCSRYSGQRNFGKIYGTIGSMMMLGSALGPLIAGQVFDVTHSYNPLLLVAVPVILLGSAMMIGLGRYPNFKDGPIES